LVIQDLDPKSEKWPQVAADLWERRPDAAQMINQDDYTKQQEAEFKFNRDALMAEGRPKAAHHPATAHHPETVHHPETFANAKDSRQGLPPMKLTLYIPPPPEEKDQAIAITAYSDTGRTYPMTSG